MAYETYTILREMVANRRNKTYASLSSENAVILNNAIIDACRQIYQEASFSWLKKRATLTVTAGVANLPSDYNVSYGLKAWSAVTGIANDKPYQLVVVEDLDLYTTADRVYWVNYDASAKLFVFNSNQTSDTVTIVYRFQPAALSATTDVTPIPDPWAIVWLATALWWSATEHDTDLFNNPFYPRYIERMSILKANDGAYNTPPRDFPDRSESGNKISTLMTRR